MELNHAGKMIETIYNETINSYKNVTSDICVIMPNHLHCILFISRADIESAPTIGDIMQSFKRNTTIKYINGVKSGIYPPFNKRIWQRDYFEHIIRDKNDYEQRWQYIDENPAK
jgi:REP element-mobilizing transposase RayT